MDAATEYAVKYLEQKGFEVIEDEGPFVVAKDGDEVAFVRIHSRRADERVSVGSADEKAKRDGQEIRTFARAWIASHTEFAKNTVRYDSMALLFISKDQALLRYSEYAY